MLTLLQLIKKGYQLIGLQGMEQNDPLFMPVHLQDSLACPRVLLHYPHSCFFSFASRGRCSHTVCSSEQHAKLPYSCCARLARALVTLLSGRGREKEPQCAVVFSDGSQRVCSLLAALIGARARESRNHIQHLSTPC